MRACLRTRITNLPDGTVHTDVIDVSLVSDDHAFGHAPDGELHIHGDAAKDGEHVTIVFTSFSLSSPHFAALPLTSFPEATA